MNNNQAKFDFHFVLMLPRQLHNNIMKLFYCERRKMKKKKREKWKIDKKLWKKIRDCEEKETWRKQSKGNYCAV